MARLENVTIRQRHAREALDAETIGMLLSEPHGDRDHEDRRGPRDHVGDGPALAALGPTKLKVSPALTAHRRRPA